MITGSPAGVYDAEPWIDPLMDFIRSAAASDVPQVGICFGHQILAEALGGKVIKSEKGWGVGRHTYDVVVCPAFAEEVCPATISAAVSHQDQVVEFFAGSNVDRAQHLRFIRFTVTQKCPDFAAVCRLKSACFEVLGKTRLVDSAWGCQAHRCAWHLPVVGHVARVWIGRQTTSGLQLATKVGCLIGRQPATQ